MASKVQLRHPTGNLTKAGAKAPLRQRHPTLRRKAGEGGAGANQGHTAAYAVRRPSLGKDQRPPLQLRCPWTSERVTLLMMEGRSHRKEHIDRERGRTRKRICPFDLTLLNHRT